MLVVGARGTTTAYIHSNLPTQAIRMSDVVSSYWVPTTLGMEQMTFRVPDELKEHIESKADERDTSQSEVARELLEQGTEYDDLRNEVERLNNQLQATNERNEVEDRLVRYVEHDIQWHEADVATKLKWFVFGRD